MSQPCITREAAVRQLGGLTCSPSACQTNTCKAQMTVAAADAVRPRHLLSLHGDSILTSHTIVLTCKQLHAASCTAQQLQQASASTVATAPRAATPDHAPSACKSDADAVHPLVPRQHSNEGSDPRSDAGQQHRQIYGPCTHPYPYPLPVDSGYMCCFE